MDKKRRYVLIVCFTIVAVLFLCTAALAYGWMTPINEIKESLMGPVAGAVAVFAIVGCGVSLAFGDGNINGFVRQCLFITAVLAVLIFADKYMSIIKDGGGGEKGMSSYAGSSNSSSKK